jgi:hypothetical protein
MIFMFGEACEHCHDKVFIRKHLNGMDLCLDCIDEVRLGHINKMMEKKDPVRFMEQSKRRCVECGRVIPEDARICPYCRKYYW